jgi:hypothetical protein
MVKSVVGGVLRQIVSHIFVFFRTYSDQACHSVYPTLSDVLHHVHHPDALKAAEHYGGFKDNY